MPDEGMAAVNIHRPVQWFPSDSLANPRQCISRTGRLLTWTGFAMAQPDHPRGWQWSPAVVTLMLIIAGMIAGGGYYIGYKDAENKALQQQIQHVQQIADDAHTKATYAARDVDNNEGHTKSESNNAGVKTR